jgi:hypothetical protein
MGGGKEFLKVGRVWWIAIGLCVIAAISTLLPTGASKACELGYYAHCSFTPFSTLICLVLAGGVYAFARFGGEEE